MEVKDFSEKIVNIVKNGEKSFADDHLGTALGITSGAASYALNRDSFFSSPIFHLSGLLSGAASYTVRRISEKHIKPKLRRYTSDERFKRYGLDDYYEPDSLSLEDYNKHMEKYNKKSIREIFSVAIKGFFSGGVSKDVHTTLKFFASRIRPHKRLNSLLKTSPIFVGAVFPPYGHGSLVKTCFDFVGDYEKSKEIGKALEIGDEVERKINEGFSKQEVDTYLNSFMKSKKI